MSLFDTVNVDVLSASFQTKVSSINKLDIRRTP